MGKRSRDKGAAFERRVANMITEAGPPSRRTGYEQAQDANNAPDVDTGGIFWVECSCGKGPNIRAKVKQAQEASPETQWPTVITKRDREPVLVTMLATDWCDLVSEWWERRH